MEIGEFIEQDILIFLDDRVDSEKAPERNIPIASTLYLTRDYEKELNQAIAQNQPATAKDVLHALKEQFDAAPQGSPEKEQLKALLTSLYEKFKDFLDQQHIPVELAAMNTKSAEPDEPPLPPGKTLREAVNETPITKPLPVTTTKTITESPGLAQALRRIDEALGKGEIAAAVTAYKNARQEAILYQQPLDSLVKVSTSFGRIKQTIANKAKKNVDPRPEMDSQLLLQLEQEKLMIDASLHRGKIRDAMQQYKRMRLIVQQISDPAKSRAAAEKLERIFAIISMLRKHDDERKLKARP
jgi:hypothetical protein